MNHEFVTLSEYCAELWWVKTFIVKCLIRQQVMETTVSLFMVPSSGITCHTICDQPTYRWPPSERDWKHFSLTLTRSSAFAASFANLGYISDIIIIIINTELYQHCYFFYFSIYLFCYHARWWIKIFNLFSLLNRIETNIRQRPALISAFSLSTESIVTRR